jgi:transcriptional regulator with XRE-family HTH domain
MQNFKDLLKAAKAKWQFKAEEHKLNIASSFHEYMKKLNWSNADLARELGTSRAYITKIMRGDQNLSIDKITEIADALGADVHIHLTDKGATGQWLEVVGAANRKIGFTALKSANSNYSATNLVNFEEYASVDAA